MTAEGSPGPYRAPQDWHLAFLAALRVTTLLAAHSSWALPSSLPTASLLRAHKTWFTMLTHTWPNIARPSLPPHPLSFTLL